MIEITKNYLRSNPDHVFVFGDNLLHVGYGGAAALRDEPNSYGFITKKAPNNNDKSFYKPEDYLIVFDFELKKLKNHIECCPEKTFLISKIGAGLANRYNIWEKVIEPKILKLEIYSNVKFLF
jgi:hypothetical protein